MGTITINDQLVNSFVFYGSILAIKCFLMSFFTARQRFGKKIFASEEDIKAMPKAKLSYNDPDVERVRRSHLNDIENVFPFFIVAPLYLTTNPSVSATINLFRIFTGARFLHSFVYLNQIPQPARVIAYATAMIINVYMAGVTAYTYRNYM